jgi:hypothetical protein
MRRILAIAMLVAACSSGSGEGDATVAPTITVAPVTAAPWPAAYQDDVCSALVQMQGAGEDLVELSAAAEDLDIERVSLMAYAASGYFAGIQATLIDTPSWAPGDLLVDRLREIAEEGLAATELIDEGATELDAKTVERGSAQLMRITPLIESASAAIDGLMRNRGFSC